MSGAAAHADRLHTQIASIMEVLANAAVAEICALVDGGYAALHVEISRSQKENEALHRKLRLMELNVASTRAASHLPVEDFRHIEDGRLREPGMDPDAPPPVTKQEVTEWDSSRLCSWVSSGGVNPSPAQPLAKNLSGINSGTTLPEGTGFDCMMYEPSIQQRTARNTQNPPAEDASSSYSINTGVSAASDQDILQLTVCKEEVCPEEERSPSRVKEKPEPVKIKEGPEEPEEVNGPLLTLSAVKSENADGESGDTEPVASTSTEHMKTQADVEYCETAHPTSDDQHLSSHRSVSDNTEDSDWDDDTEHRDWEETVDNQPSSATLKSHNSNVCTVCGKSFSRKGNLNVHMMTHTGEKPFTCTFCGKGYSQKSNLNAHLMTHTGEKPLTCTVCGKGCSNKGHLEVHMRTHTGEKPYKCTVCGKGCSHKSHLKVHMVTHTGEKPFTCEVCKKDFGRMGHLKTHMKTHKEEKAVFE